LIKNKQIPKEKLNVASIISLTWEKIYNDSAPVTLNPCPINYQNIYISNKVPSTTHNNKKITMKTVGTAMDIYT
jgi:hypothetical protein